jgi:CheY-like chemotaxis protein
MHWIDDRGRTAFDDEGRPLYMTGACVDITDRKEAERILREAALRKEEFLAMLAHELRNPLAPIRNSIDLLRQLHPGEGRAAQAHAIIDRQIGHLVRLVDDLLDVSRIARGKIELRRERCSVTSIVRQTVDDYRPMFAARDIAVTSTLPPHEVWVDGDATRLSQIVSNILHNSSKFTPRGGWVVVRLNRRDGDRTVVLEIEDTGSGMDADMLQRLFEPFAQGARHDDSVHGGLGLGLAVVRGLAELHGGTVAASSDGPNCGTRITVQLPTADASTGAVAGARPGRLLQPLRVLVIDDNVDGANSLQMILEMLGHHAEAVYHGHEAVGAAERVRPDVLLCDIGLPGGMDGYDIARSFRAHPELQRTYLIALTGWGQPEDRRKALDAGFDLHLTKPASPDQLEALLANLSAKKR